MKNAANLEIVLKVVSEIHEDKIENDLHKDYAKFLKHILTQHKKVQDDTSFVPYNDWKEESKEPLTKTPVKAKAEPSNVDNSEIEDLISMHRWICDEIGVDSFVALKSNPQATKLLEFVFDGTK